MAANDRDRAFHTPPTPLQSHVSLGKFQQMLWNSSWDWPAGVEAPFSALHLHMQPLTNATSQGWLRCQFPSPGHTQSRHLPAPSHQNPWLALAYMPCLCRTSPLFCFLLSSQHLQLPLGDLCPSPFEASGNLPRGLVKGKPASADSLHGVHLSQDVTSSM